MPDPALGYSPARSQPFAGHAAGRPNSDDADPAAGAEVHLERFGNAVTMDAHGAPGPPRSIGVPAFPAMYIVVQSACCGGVDGHAREER